MSHHHQAGQTVMLRLAGTIVGTATSDGETTGHHIRLDVGGEIELTPEHLAAATAAGEALDVLLTHVRTGEPLDWGEVEEIKAGTLACVDEFQGVGGGPYMHRWVPGEE